jgi:hypothetical protein
MGMAFGDNPRGPFGGPRYSTASNGDRHGPLHFTVHIDGKNMITNTFKLHMFMFTFIAQPIHQYSIKIELETYPSMPRPTGRPPRAEPPPCPS